eukprot:TRINITY_DN24027_c0_g1_i4.p1 TRINITY_DN24027_c0_g1~~TRINITY_DN24027_c0_g1_i4.p1  ORF type:complete len:158 (+),score=32.97 TRINITY_DN24027_c0_g1_i4:161-634(+)
MPPHSRPQFDPPKILGQISLLQLALYLSLGLILVCLNWLTGYNLSIQLLGQQFFSGDAINFSSIAGVLTVFAHLLNAVAGGFLLSIVVKRAKQCLDFTVTARLIDLVCCCAVQGWPRTLGWWMTSVLSAAIMAVLGEWFCMRIELQEIPLRQIGDDL